MGELSPLKLFKDMHRGARMVVVCNGPSLNRMDLRFLRSEIVIGLNKIHLGLDQFGFYPRYLVAVNRKVIEQSAKVFARMTATKFISELGADLLPEDALTYHIKTENLPGRFYADITEGVRGGHTVTHAALQIAFYMGASEVVIIGMDHRFQADGPPNAELFMPGDDPNHFAPGYFGGQKWDAPNLPESEVSYAAARAAYEADGRRILDATVDGACTVFDKVDYRSVFA